MNHITDYNQGRRSLWLARNILVLLVLPVCVCVFGKAWATSVGLCDFAPGETWTGMGCAYGSCVYPVWEGICQGWKNSYGYVQFVAYTKRRDCEGDALICKAACGSGFCAYDTMGECIEYHRGPFEAPWVWALCDGGAGGSPPFPEAPPGCDQGDVCCFGAGGGAGGSGGGSGGGGGGSPLYSGSGPSPAEHSPAPGFVFRFDNTYKIDRGLGVGWSHNYLYALQEDETFGTIAALTPAGGTPWLYYAQRGGTYLAAPYDRTELVKYADHFEARSRDDITFIYSLEGRLENITDLNGNSLSLIYDGGLLEGVSDGFNRSLQFFYDASGHLTSISGPAGDEYRFSYRVTDDGQYNLIRVTYPDDSTDDFSFEDPHDPHNLTLVIDRNGNPAAGYEYDTRGRVISKQTPGSSETVEVDYNPESELFSDDFQDQDLQGWDESGTVDVAADPDPDCLPGELTARLHPGTISYRLSGSSEQKLQLSLDLYVTAGSGDFSVKIYDSTRGEDYGPWLHFTASGDVFEVSAEYVYHDDQTSLDETFQLPVPGLLTAEEWHRLEIEADARQYYSLLKLWIDCEYLIGHPFKREAAALDTVEIEASEAGADIYLDNFLLEKEILDDSKLLFVNDKGTRRSVEVIGENRFGGKSWKIRESGRATQGRGCSSCAAAGTKLYEYDDRWMLRRIVDGRGIAQEMTYDGRGNMLSKTEAAGTPLERTTIWTWHTDFNKPLTESLASVDATGQQKVTTYTYDTHGNLESETVAGYSGGQPASATTSYQYNAYGQVTETDGPRTDVADVTAYRYDRDNGTVSSITYPNGTVYYDDYDGNHRAGSVTDLNGVETHFTYDYAGRVTTITVGSAVTEYLYDKVGTIDYVILPEGTRIDYDYNGSYNLIKITDDVGSYIQYAYDGQGNRVREEYRDAGHILRKFLDFDHDHAGRLTMIRNPDNSYTGFDYDNNTNRTLMVDPLGTHTQYEYDELNLLVKVIQAAGYPEEAVTEYAYDGHDNLIRVTDAEGRITSYSYDDFGRLVETVSPDTGITRYSYDGAGNLTVKTDAKGVTTQYAYDALNRLTRIDYPTDPDTVYTYDETDVTCGKGRLTGISDASGTTRYGYGLRGNTIEVCAAIEGQIYTTQYQYDLNNQLIGIVYPTGRVVDYALNAAGTITDIAVDGASLVTGMEHEPFGGLQEMTFSRSGITTSLTRDTQYRIKQIQAGSIVDRTYTHDFAGNITSIKQNPGDGLPAVQPYRGSDTYQYVPKTSKLQQISSSSTGTFVYTHDANGNVISDGTRTFTYNENNRMVGVDTGVETVYTYNGKGQRVKKANSTGTVIYHYDLQGNLIEETDENGNLLKDYIYAGSERVAMFEGGSLYYFHNDHLGTPLALTDTGGQIVWSASYTPFGEAVVDASSTIDNNFRFPGQYYDEETGLHYNWHRYYDPWTGRYLRPDPSGIREGENHLYVYVKNNPNTFIDPQGLEGCGPGSGFWEWAIPDYPFGYNFSSCCDEHDDCYGCLGKDRGKSKRDCDIRFCKCLINKCESVSYSV